MNNDKELIKKRFAATFKHYNLLAHTQQEICDRLAAMIPPLPFSPTKALEVGTGTGFLTEKLTATFPTAKWFLNDLTQASEEYLEPMLAGIEHEYLWGDAEELEFPVELGLVASASTVQWFDDLPAFIQKCADSTAAGGMLALTTFGHGNFEEIKTITGQGLAYHTIEEIKIMFTRSGYRIEHSLEYTRMLSFESPIEVLRHIKATGVNGIDKTVWTKRQLSDFEARYREQFSLPEGGVRLTYHPIIFTAYRK